MKFEVIGQRLDFLVKVLCADIRSTACDESTSSKGTVLGSR